MAEDKSIDVLMMLMLSGNPVAADCKTQFSKASLDDPNSLLDGFKKGFFFEIQSIDVRLAAPAPDASPGGAPATSSSGVQVEEITISRQIDRASMVLLQACIEAQPFDSATVIKRRAAGGGQESGQAYLRFDFNGVLITKIDWSDEHIVKENITFRTRGLEMRYRRQLASGVLSEKLMQARYDISPQS